MINFGLPYKGSKSIIAADLIRVIPPGERFVDVFAGGCAMTHAALLAGRWKSYLANDITDAPENFIKAIRGGFKDERRWISREDFFELKDSDFYARFCFSFGNNGEDYMYNTSIEPYKRACHFAVVFDDWAEMLRLCPEVVATCRAALSGKASIKERRLAFGPAVVRKLRTLDAKTIKSNTLYNSVKRSITKKTYNPSGLESLERIQSLQSLESLERLERLQSLESLERLERLQSLERLERLQSLGLTARRGDYRGIEINPGDVLYCDPPYKGTGGYNGTSFDAEAFYFWAEEKAKTNPVFISEYNMPEDRFLCVWKRAKISRMSPKGSEFAATEKLFVPRRRKSDNLTTK